LLSWPRTRPNWPHIAGGEGAEADVGLAVANVYPDVTYSTSYTFQDGLPDPGQDAPWVTIPSGSGVGPLTIFNRNQGISSVPASSFAGRDRAGETSNSKFRLHWSASTSGKHVTARPSRRNRALAPAKREARPRPETYRLYVVGPRPTVDVLNRRSA